MLDSVVDVYYTGYRETDNNGDYHDRARKKSNTRNSKSNENIYH